MNEDDEHIERALRRVKAALRAVDPQAMSLSAFGDVVDVSFLVDIVTSERAKRARAEHALADALDRVERFEAQSAEHWLRLARCRAVLYLSQATDEERQAVLKATATDDAPAMDAIERAQARIDFPRA